MGASIPPDGDERVAQRRFARAREVLWRLADDRVLVLRMQGQGPRLAAELTGPPAALWLMLDEPSDERELAALLTTAGCDDPATELARGLDALLTHRLIEERELLDDRRQ